MKLTRNVVRQFEHDQEAYGTEVALYNVLWLNASEQLSDIGVVHIKTVHKDGSGKKGGDRIEKVELGREKGAKRGKKKTLKGHR